MNDIKLSQNARCVVETCNIPSFTNLAGKYILLRLCVSSQDKTRDTKKFLNEGGAIIYPALNLSNTTKLKSLAELNFSNTTVLGGKDWPFKFNNPSFEFKLDEFKNIFWGQFTNCTGKPNLNINNSTANRLRAEVIGL